MCGRYNFVMTPEMTSLFEDLGVSANFSDLYNIAPTEAVPIIRNVGDHNECHLARWWLTPSWAKKPDTKYSMFNARAENLESSPAFKGPFHKKRCILPASSFIEWQQTDSEKQPYAIMRANKPIVFAGLWDCWNEELLSCTIITTQAAGNIRDIHERMPVMLDKKGIIKWLDPEASIDQLDGLLESKLPYQLETRAISKAINNSRNKAPYELIVS